MEFSSKLLQKAVEEISQLPGIGKRTALRLSLHLLKQPLSQSIALSESIKSLREDITFCENCHNISDNLLCEICSNPNRNKSLICVVEDIRDVMAIESTSAFKGVYHVLGGIISPMDGIGPADLTITSLIDKINNSEIKEVVFALSPSIEGDTTNFYIYKQIEKSGVKTSTIARGIAVGNEIEYVDEITLGRSILNRIPYETNISS